MVAERKKIEFWNFLTTEKNQPRPKGITVHRLAMLKSAILESEELWSDVIERRGAENRSAAEFYQSNEAASTESRTCFWNAVRKLVSGKENNPREGNKPARATAAKPRRQGNPGTGKRKRP